MDRRSGLLRGRMAKTLQEAVESGLGHRKTEAERRAHDAQPRYSPIAFSSTRLRRRPSNSA